MAGLPLIVYYNRVSQSGTTITTGSEQSAYPAANLAINDHVHVWRSVDASIARKVVFDFGSAKAVDFAFIPRFHNLTSSAVVKVQFNSTDSWDPPAATEELDVTAGKAIAKTFTSHSYRYARLYISDTSNPDGYLEVPNVWLGQRKDLTTAPGPYTRRPIVPGRGAVSTINTRRVYRSGALAYGFTLPWSFNAADQAIWEAAMEYAAEGPMVLALDRDDLDDTTYLVNWLDAQPGGKQSRGELTESINTGTQDALITDEWDFEEEGAGLDQ